MINEHNKQINNRWSMNMKNRKLFMINEHKINRLILDDQWKLNKQEDIRWPMKIRLTDKY